MERRFSDMNWLKYLVIPLLSIFRALSVGKVSTPTPVESCGILSADFCKPEIQVPEDNGVYT